MTRRKVRIAAEMPLARIIGSRWDVAICETEWATFLHIIDPKARDRLLVVLDHFCDHGDANLPRLAFRWLANDMEKTGAARQGAFEARGVVVRGRAAPSGKRPTFFVTSIEQDPPATPMGPKSRRARSSDGRQSRLPLTFTTERN